MLLTGYGNKDRNSPLDLVRCSTLDLFTKRLGKTILVGVVNMHVCLCVSIFVHLACAK